MEHPLMRIGIFGGEAPIDELLAMARKTEADGFD